MEYTTFHFCRYGVSYGLISTGNKSILIHSSGHMEEIEYIVRLFGMDILNLEEGFTYLGFRLKPNKYRVRDWS